MTKKSIVRPAVIYILFFFFFFDNFLDESATQSCRVSLSLQINRFFFFILAELCPAASTEVNLVNLRLSPFHHGESNGVTPQLAVWEETSSLLGLNLCNFSWVGKNKTLCCPSGLPFIVIFLYNNLWGERFGLGIHLSHFFLFVMLDNVWIHKLQ